MAQPQTTPLLPAIIATAIIGLTTGYMLRMGSELGLFSSSTMKARALQPKIKVEGKTDNYENEEESSEEEIEDMVVLDHAPNWANGLEADKRDGLRVTAKEEKKSRPDEFEDSVEECKLMLVVRTDLGMTKGKIAAQCSHATLACYKALLRRSPQSTLLRRWERTGQAKIAVQIKSEAEMELLQAKAMSLGIVAEIIADAGRTQIASGSHTVLGIGPAPKSVVDQVTAGLKLL